MSLRKYSRYEVCFHTEFVDQSFKFVLDTEAEAALAERDKEIERLRRACAVLYWGSPELHHVAENAYSGCASTQRDDPYELRKVLEARDDESRRRNKPVNS